MCISKLFHIQKAVSYILGEPVFLAGGCVRDTLYGAEPKDYDAIVMCDGGDLQDVFQTMKDLSFNLARRGISSEVYRAYESANSGELTSFQKMFKGCMKLHLHGAEVDLLFSTFNDIDVHVANHDCNMNAVYLDLDGNIVGDKVDKLVFIEGISDERKAYMEKKFLELSAL